MTNCWLVCIFIAQYVIVCVWCVFVCNCVCMCVEIMNVCREKNHFWHKKWNRGKLLNIILFHFMHYLNFHSVCCLFHVSVYLNLSNSKKDTFMKKICFVEILQNDQIFFFNNWIFSIKSKNVKFLHII
jgi:hypothetical protein